jgi:hypothetical protein
MCEQPAASNAGNKASAHPVARIPAGNLISPLLAKAQRVTYAKGME